MDNFEVKKVDFSNINGGQRYQNGDVVDADAINAPIEAAAFAQSLATNQPNIENIQGTGTPSVSIEELPEGGARLVFSNLKGERGQDGADHSQEISELNAKISDFEVQSNLSNSKQNEIISRNDKRITNLEQGLAADNFETDASVAYSKNVPLNALPYAAIGIVGGMTRKCANLILFPYVDTTQTKEGVTWTVNNDYSISVMGNKASTGNDITFLLTNRIKLPAGTYRLSGLKGKGDYATYHLCVDVYNTDGSWSNIFYDLGYGGTVTITEGQTATIFIRIYNSYVGDVNFTVYPMLNEGSTALPYEPYFDGLRSAPTEAVESVGANMFGGEAFADRLVEFGGIKDVSAGTVFIKGAMASGKIAYNNFKENTRYTFIIKAKGTTDGTTPFTVRYTDGTTTALKLYTANEAKVVVYVSDDSKSVSDFCGVFYDDTTYYYDECGIFEGVLTEAYFKPYTRNTLPIPEAVQTLDGYGEGNPNDATEYNYIDFENQKFVKKGHIVDGEWVRDEDVTDIIFVDNLLPVEGGGTITMVNEYGYAVPSEVIYQLKGVAE